MAFYYPNIQNDMWRIVGLCFFADKQHFIAPDGRHYREEELKAFLTCQGIALYDTCTRIVRTQGTASDKDLLVVEQTDIVSLLDRLPQCRAIVTAGQLATTLCCRQLDALAEAERQREGATAENHCVCPKVGEYATVTVGGRQLRLYRMPSSSRAYPMALEKKASMYQRVFDYCFLE